MHIYSIVSIATPEIETWWGGLTTPDYSGPGADPASYTLGSGSFPGVKRKKRGVNHPHRPAPRLKKK